MSAPYQVWIDDAGDSRYIDCQTIDDAIRKAAAVAPRRHRVVRIIGDGAEGGYGDDGTGWWDGLTADERELVEGALS